MFFVFSLIPVSTGCTIDPRTYIPSSFPLPFLQLQLPLRFRLHLLQQLLLLCFFPQPPPVLRLPQQLLDRATVRPLMDPLNFLLFYPCSPPFPNTQMFFLCLQHPPSPIPSLQPLLTLWPPPLHPSTAYKARLSSSAQPPVPPPLQPTTRWRVPYPAPPLLAHQ